MWQIESAVAGALSTTVALNITTGTSRTGAENCCCLANFTMPSDCPNSINCTAVDCNATQDYYSSYGLGYYFYSYDYYSYYDDSSTSTEPMCAATQPVSTCAAAARLLEEDTNLRGKGEAVAPDAPSRIVGGEEVCPSFAYVCAVKTTSSMCCLLVWGGVLSCQKQQSVSEIVWSTVLSFRYDGCRYTDFLTPILFGSFGKTTTSSLSAGCGGTLYGRRHVITAAHCLETNADALRGLAVEVGAVTCHTTQRAWMSFIFLFECR